MTPPAKGSKKNSLAPDITRLLVVTGAMLFTGGIAWGMLKYQVSQNSKDITEMKSMREDITEMKIDVGIIKSYIEGKPQNNKAHDNE